MPTGDLTNNLRKLQKEVKLIKYNEDIDLANMSLGKPTAFLPLYHYAFTSYSHSVAELIASSDAELYGKTDFRFIEAMYKILRDLFSYKPLITKEQFFNAGFAERKIIMCSEVLHMVREKSRVLNPPKKSVTGGTAVSGLVQLGSAKGNRPKSAEPASNETSTSSSALTKRSKTVMNSKQVRVTSPREATSAPQVVNELLQPHKPHSHPIRHMTSHVTDYRQHQLLPTGGASPSHLTKERLATKMPIQASSEVHFIPVPSSLARSVPVNTVSTEHNEEDEDEDESDEDEIETVNAVTRGESFLEPQYGTQRPASQLQVQQSEETLQYNRTIQAVVDRMNSLDSVVKNIAGLVESQAAASPSDKVNATLTTIQQQLETLMARMVLVENRVALVEARISGSQQTVANEARNGWRNPGHGNPDVPHGAAQTLDKTTTQNTNRSESHTKPSVQTVGGNLYYSNTQSNGGTDAHKAPNVPSNIGAGDGYNKQSSGVVDIHTGRSTSSVPTPQGAQPAGQQIELITANHSNGSSVFSDLLSGPPPNLTSGDINDSTAVGLSPIRKPTDLSVNHSVSLPPFDLTSDDTFAAVTQDEKRLSSTPTKHPVMLESLEDSLSFHFGDTTSEERMLRIKTMIKETKNMLTKPTSNLTGDGNS